MPIDLNEHLRQKTEIITTQILAIILTMTRVEAIAETTKIVDFKPLKCRILVCQW